MIKSLSNITDISVIDQNVNNNLLSFHKIDFNETEIGSGAFGSVYKVTSIDGEPSINYVLKLYSDEINKQHAYDVIKLLHEKLKRQQQKTSLPSYHEFPELIGLPFLAFKGYDNIAEKHCVAFLMYNLFDLGYEDYGSDKGTSIEYKNLLFPDKLYLAYQFSKTINFLHSIEFINADISEQSIFINPREVRLALIDFDSGYHFDKQKKPTTIGKITQWAKNIIRSKNKSDEITTEDRLFHEYELLASGLFEIIFGVMPYFFLKDADEQTKREYLATNQWPFIDENSPLFNKENAITHSEIIRVLSELEVVAKELIKGFKKVFNQGYDDKRKRLSPLEWKNILEELNRSVDNQPFIENFISNKSEIKFKGEEVQLQWDVKKENRIFINNVLMDRNVNEYSLALNDTSIVTIIAINDLSRVEEVIKVKAIKIDPAINEFKASKLIRDSEKEVMLTWETENVAYVNITSLDDKLEPNGFVDVRPIIKADYTLTAYGFFDQKVESTITLDVIEPRILNFVADVNLNEGIDNVDLKWETENTERVFIEPLIGEKEANGISHVALKEKTEFKLIAHGLFSKVEHVINAYPFPVPIIEQIHNLKPIIEFNMHLDTTKLEIPENLASNEKIYFKNNIEFKNLDFQHSKLSDSMIEPNFALDNELINRMEKKKISFADYYQKIKNRIFNINNLNNGKA